VTLSPLTVGLGMRARRPLNVDHGNPEAPLTQVVGINFPALSAPNGAFAEVRGLQPEANKGHDSV
jgi:hypothetical protein